MKTSWLTIVLLVYAVSSIQGQDSQSGPPANAGQGTVPAQDTPYAVVSKGANEQVWQKTTYETLPSGETVAQIHQYTELATGLHYWSNGQWLDSKEEIDILPNGTAAATNGQHQVYFPGNIYQGEIQLVTPDGKQLQTQPIGLSYDDGSNSVLIAVATNSIGQLVGPNQVLYPDAFTGFKADLLYIYTKAGFEQDVILREQPPMPESLGLSANARLQVLTEFFDPPQPTVTTTKLPNQAGIALTNENLDFGVMKMVPGRAFLVGSNSSAGNVQVAKQWVQVGGRQILVEEVPVAALAAELETLPLPQGASTKTGTTVHLVASHHWQLPLPHLVQAEKPGQFKRMAAATPLKQGLVLDYQTVNTSLTNYTFQGDTTYYISGEVDLSGTNNILEGGAVLKLGTNSSAEIYIGSGATLNCQTAPYQPAIFTAVDDNSIGATITNSTGNPTNYYGSFGLYFESEAPTVLHDLRLAYLNSGIYSISNSIRDVQFVNCFNSVNYATSDSDIILENVLIQGGTCALWDICGGGGTVSLVNCTIHNVGNLSSQYGLAMTNCLVVGVDTNYCSFDGVSNVFLSSDAGVFQIVGAGANYLATNSLCFNAGTTNIDPTLLAALRLKTTYPPILYSSVTITTNLTLNPLAQRDTNSNPAVGYHYDPIDYLVSNVTVSATLTLTNGVALGLMGSSASLTIKSNLNSQGKPLNLNHLAHYANVQEQPVNLGSGGLAGGQGSLAFRFTDISMLAGADTSTFATVHGYGGNVSFRDCLLHGCHIAELVTYSTYSVTYTNNLFDRCIWESSSASGVFAAFYNNLFRGGSCMFNSTNAAVPWYVQDNLFDQVNLSGSATGTNYIISSNNGFTAGTTNLLGGTNNKTNLMADYQAGPLGNYYYPTNGTNLATLIHAGSTNASALGLYHYTITTNEAIEGTNTVSIGFHYVAVDTNGIPFSTPGDGIPDYLADANGNGLDDSGEMPWDIAILSQPQNLTVPAGSNATFTVTAGGVPSLSYQWWFNGTNIAGATNLSYTVNPATPTNAGNYWIIVSNYNLSASLPSSNATLSVMSWTVDSDGDGISDAQEIVDGTDPFNPDSAKGLLGRWHFDDTNWLGAQGQVPLMATNLQLVPSWSSNAVEFDTPDANLQYRLVEENGHTNLNMQCGTVRFWFCPNWSSVVQGGAGPNNYARLIEVAPGMADWGMYIYPDGNTLGFVSGDGSDDGWAWLDATIFWTSNQWHQVAVTYSPTNTVLYIDGVLADNEDNIATVPTLDYFTVGNDYYGDPAMGRFDELDTFDYPLSADRIAVDYLASGVSSNVISFSFSVVNQYVTTNMVNGVITILGGIPLSIAVLVDGTNFAGANWIPYTSSNITVNLGANQGPHDVWIGLRGLPANAQTWEETTLILNSTQPAIAITSPVDNASFNASRVNVGGNFTAASLKQITVNGTLAFVNGTNFEALIVPLAAGTNIITAVIEDLTGMTNAASITVTGITNADGSMNNPVQLQATPVAGFAPLSVVFQITSNSAPGILQQVFYDFNGDDIADFVTNNLDPITYTYATNGEYFPVVTIQTDLGRFSSIGGWNSASIDPSNQPVQINVQTPPTQSTLTNVSNPVDLKWDGTHLYVLSGSGAAIYEFATNGTTIRSLGGIGTNPSGIDVDGSGNVYVAVTGSNQVWKFNPTTNSFQFDTNFGIGGCIGLTNGVPGANNGEFNAPFDVAVSPDGSQISVSDSGNNRIQQFSATDGSFIASFGSQGSAIGQFNTPKGLTYDSVGTLYVVDSGNNRIVMAEGSSVMDATGTGEADLGQFSGPVNISVGKRGVYVADTGNGRIQKFDLPAQGLFEITSGNVSYALSTNLSSPASVAAVDHPTDELFYVADTGHNQVLLCQVPDQNVDAILAVWNSMKACVANGHISGAMQFFSSVTANDYNQDFLAIGAANVISAIGQIGILTPAYINGDEAEYYFQQTINGRVLTFKVEFVKENGVWKIFEF